MQSITCVDGTFFYVLATISTGNEDRILDISSTSLPRRQNENEGTYTHTYRERERERERESPVYASFILGVVNSLII